MAFVLLQLGIDHLFVVAAVAAAAIKGNLHLSVCDHDDDDDDDDD